MQNTLMKKALKIDSLITDIMKQFRSQAKLSQNELADILDVPRSFISEYENNERNLSFGETWKITHALGIGPETLVELIDYRLRSSKDSEYEEDIKKVRESFRNECLQADLMSINKFESDIATLKHEAFEAGKARGLNKVRVKRALNMLEDGLDIDLICTRTSLAKERVQELKQELEEGRAEARRETALKLLEMGMDVPSISKVTELPEKEVKQMAKKPL